MGTRVQSVAKTHIGLVRAHNEDNFIVGVIEKTGEWSVPMQEIEVDQNAFVFCIADGMGGEKAGEIASEVAVQAVQQYLMESISQKNEDQDLTKPALIFAHNSIKQVCLENPDQVGMGTTAVLGVLNNNRLHISWVGDSRLYRYSKFSRITENNFGSGNLEIMTNDHSKVWEMVLQGHITPEEARVHPESNIITQSLGDVFRTPQPDTINVPVCKDDIFLVCTDGLNGMLSDEEIEKSIDQFGNDLNHLADVLIDMANQKGGVDNITLVLFKILEGMPYQKSMILNLQPQLNSAAKTVSVIRNNKLLYGFALLFVIAGLAALYFYFNQKTQYSEKEQTQTTNVIDTSLVTDTVIIDTLNLPIVEEVKPEVNELKKPQDVYLKKHLDSLRVQISLTIDSTEQGISKIGNSSEIEGLKKSLKNIRKDFNNAKPTMYSLKIVQKRADSLLVKVDEKLTMLEKLRKRRH